VGSIRVLKGGRGRLWNVSGEVGGDACCPHFMGGGGGIRGGLVCSIAGGTMRAWAMTENCFPFGLKDVNNGREKEGWREVKRVIWSNALSGGKEEGSKKRRSIPGRAKGAGGLFRNSLVFGNEVGKKRTVQGSNCDYP